MNRGSKDEGEDHGADDSADNSYGERLKHLRALADSEGQREHAGDRGKSGHGDGTKTPAASLNHGILRRKTEGAKAMLGVQEKRSEERRVGKECATLCRS